MSCLLLFVCLFVCLFICLFVCLFVCLFLFVCLLTRTLSYLISEDRNGLHGSCVLSLLVNVQDCVLKQHPTGVLELAGAALVVLQIPSHLVVHFRGRLNKVGGHQAPLLLQSSSMQRYKSCYFNSLGYILSSYRLCLLLVQSVVWTLSEMLDIGSRSTAAGVEGPVSPVVSCS